MATDSDRTINSRFQPRPYYFPINFLFLFEHTSLSLSLSLSLSAVAFRCAISFQRGDFCSTFLLVWRFFKWFKKKRKKKKKNILLDIIHPTQSPATHARRWPADRLRRWSFFCFVLLLLLLLLLLLFYFLRVLVLSAAFPFLFGARESPTHPNPAPCKKTKKQKTKQKNNQYESPRDWCPVFLLSFPFFGFFTCDESQRSILRFFFWRVCFHFYFCSVVGGELLIDDQQWQRTPLFCFFLGFFLGRTINGPLSWLMNDCPSTVRPPAGAVDVTVVDVCLFFCHLFGFPDFHRPLFFSLPPATDSKSVSLDRIFVFDRWISFYWSSMESSDCIRIIFALIRFRWLWWSVLFGLIGFHWILRGLTGFY